MMKLRKLEEKMNNRSNEKKKKKKRDREIRMLNEVWHGERQQAQSDAENGEIEYGNVVNDGRKRS